MANVEDVPPTGSWRKSVYPVYIEAQAGMGSKPAGMFSIGDDKDRALAWTKTAKGIVSIAALVLSLAGSAAAGILTPNLGLNKWQKGDLATDYLPKQNTDQDTLDAAICDKRGSCTIAGDLNVLGTIISTNTGTLGGGGSVGFVQDDLLPFVDGVETNFVLTSTPSPTSLLVLVRDGLVLHVPTDYTITGDVLTTAVAPSLLTSSFFIQYSTLTSSGGGGGSSSSTVVAQFPILGIGSVGNPLRLDSSSATLLGPSISQNELTFVPATSFDLAVIGASTANLQNQINAGIPSTVVVDAPLLGNGSGGSHLRVDGTSVTLQGNNFNGPGMLSKLDINGNLNLDNGNFTATHTAPHAAPMLDLAANDTGDAVRIVNSNATTGTGLLMRTGLDANYTMLMTNAASASQHAFFGSGRVRLNIAGTAQVVSVEGTGGLNLTQGPITTNGPNGNITSQSSVTASGFFGNGSGLTNITATSEVAASSAPAVNINVNSVTPVGIATTTITGIGGNHLLVFLSANIVNSAVGARIFTFRLLKNGAVVLGPSNLELASGVAGLLNYHYFENSSTVGSQNWTLDVLSNNATGTQTANNPRVTVVEFP